MKSTSIQWTTFSANPLKYRTADGKVVWACVKTSPGCSNCYAEDIAMRYSSAKRPGGVFGAANMRELTPFMDEDELHKILTAKTVDKIPTAGGKVFVGDMTDVFGEWVPFELIDKLFAVMALRRDMTFQVLTKRPERMAEYLLTVQNDDKDLQRFANAACDLTGSPCTAGLLDETDWPLPNVWLGTSVENQKYADERIPHLLKCPAAVRFLSCEPLLGPVELTRWCGWLLGVETAKSHGFVDGDRAGMNIDWVITGGESGEKARPCEIEWIKSIIYQCRDSAVPVFVKQLGKICNAPWPEVSGPETRGRVTLTTSDGKGGTIAEWPPELRVREFPKVGAA